MIGFILRYGQRNAKAGLGGQDQHSALFNDAALNRIISGKTDAIQICVRNDGLRCAEMSGGDDTDWVLEHTADHTFYAVFLCGGGDFHCAADTAGFHQLDIDEVSGAGGNHPNCVAEGENSLIRHDVGMAILGDIAQAVEIIIWGWLLDQLNIEIMILKIGDDADSLFRRPALICIDAELYLAADSLSYLSDADEIGFYIFANFYFQDAITAADCFNAILDHLTDIADADGEIRFNAVRCAAEGTVKRKTQHFGIEIVDCDIDACLCTGVMDAGILDHTENRILIGDIHADDLRSDDILNDGSAAGGRIPGDFFGRGSRADADGSVVGMDHNNEVIDMSGGADSSFKRFTQRNAQG